jgi:hypothetical protein
MIFYRFRPTDALLDRFQELERQEIYFAHPQELNDPLEGFKDLVWSGDRILWGNLLRHYLLSLTYAVTVALISGPDHTFSEMETFVFANQSSMPTPVFGELHRRICEDFFKHEDAAALPELLADRGNPIRRDELTTYLRLLHLYALNTVLTCMEEAALLPPRPADDPLRAANKKPIAVRAIIEVLKGHEREHPDKTDIAETLSSSYEAVAIQQDLISEYNGISLKRGVAWKAVISEFPRRHVRALEQLLYRDWYTACFVAAAPTDASIWGTYGNGHRGVCLMFKSTTNTNGKQALSLRQICGWSGNKVSSGPVYGDMPHEFQQVEYNSQFIEVNFFRSLGRLSMPMLNSWYRDADGTPSALVADILSESASWRKQYWEQQVAMITTKLTDWGQEKEFRLTLTGMSDFSDQSTRKLQYHFSDLQGIIFGLNTSTSDKLRIMKIIEEKCRKEGRTDFEFHQAHYSRRTRKMEITKMSLIKFA